ncbi:MAG: ABC transporter substrate-binding protein [Lachnospiraceae bacterium]|jgi:branched-chain amino acid transport system substrate-binding protein
MKKRVLSLLLAGVLAIGSLVGCGGSDEGTDEGSAASEDAGEEGAASDGLVFKIGGIGPTTGGAAIYGQCVKNSMELAAEAINADGGINGYQVEVNFQDDESDSEKSKNAYNTLKDWGMQALLGTVTSTPCIAVAAEAASDNMFLLTPSGSSADCVTASDAHFRVCFSDPNQGMASAKYIGENGLATKVAVIYDSAETYSTGIYETFAAEAANQPFEIVAAEAFQGADNKDFSTQLQAAKTAGAELIFLPIYYQAASLILSQADSMGYDATFFGCDGMDGILTLDGFDTALAEGVMLLTPFAADAEDEATQAYVSAYKEAYGEIPNQFGADAWDGMYAIKAAFEDQDIKPDMSVEEIAEAAKAGMLNITVMGLTGGEDGIVWSEDGEPNKEPKAVVIENGAYKAM